MRNQAHGEDAHPLLERERELDTLSGAVSAAAEGAGSLVLIEGTSGIGKTALISLAAEIAAQEGFLVRSGRGGEMEREMPFGLVRQLFEPLVERAPERQRREWLSGSASQALTALGHASVDPDPDARADPYGAINGLYWLVANLAIERPLLLAVDDLQWSDRPSLRFLAFLARRLRDLPVAVVGAVRTGEPTEPRELSPLRTEAAVVNPLPLGEASIVELVRIRIGAAASLEFSEACAIASAGNPFLLSEILREFRSTGRQPDADAAESVRSLVPDNVVRTVLSRLEAFGPEAVAIARSIAILGRSPQLRHAASLAATDEQAARVTIDQLRAADILAAGTPIDFVHPLVRQAVYESTPEEQRAAAHRVAAELLDGAGASPEEVANHLLACPPNGDPWVVDRLRDAARTAFEESALEAAVTYLDRALLEPPEDDLVIRYHMAIALLSVDIFRAPEVLEDVAGRTKDRNGRVELHRRLSGARMQIGDFATAAEALDTALEAANGDDREQTLALEADRYFCRIAAGIRTDDDRARIERIAADLRSDSAGERVARQALGVDRFMANRPVDEVISLCLPFPEGRIWKVAGHPSPSSVAATKFLAFSGRWSEARRVLEARADEFHQLGRPLALSVTHSLLSDVDRLAGRLRDAESEARTAWEIAGMAGGDSIYGWSALMGLAASLLARGDIDALVAFIGEADLSGKPPAIPVNPWPLEVRAHLRVAQDDLSSAVDDFLELGDAMEALGWLNPVYPPWRQEAAEALARLGRGDEAKDLLLVAEERAERFGAPHAIASVLRARAMVEPRERAADTLHRSIELLERSGPPHELARSLVVLGGVLRRGGDRTDARHVLHRGLEVAHTCGAGGVERAAREELAAAGARPRRAQTTGIGSLTASELKTARLAVSGLSNKEIAERLFVTVRTVETHLTRVYDKLGVAGRRELKQALTELG